MITNPQVTDKLSELRQQKQKLSRQVKTLKGKTIQKEALEVIK